MDDSWFGTVNKGDDERKRYRIWGRGQTIPLQLGGFRRWEILHSRLAAAPDPNDASLPAQACQTSWPWSDIGSTGREWESESEKIMQLEHLNIIEKNDSVGTSTKTSSSFSLLSLPFLHHRCHVPYALSILSMQSPTKTRTIHLPKAEKTCLPELFTVTQHQVHVLIICHKSAHKYTRIGQNDAHTVVDKLLHLCLPCCRLWHY